MSSRYISDNLRSFIALRAKCLQTKHFILRTAYVPYRLLHTTWTVPSIDRKSVHGVSMSIGFAF